MFVAVSWMIGGMGCDFRNLSVALGVSVSFLVWFRFCSRLGWICDKARSGTTFIYLPINLVQRELERLLRGKLEEFGRRRL